MHMQGKARPADRLRGIEARDFERIFACHSTISAITILTLSQSAAGS
jgi:hypothetical protein